MGGLQGTQFERESYIFSNHNPTGLTSQSPRNGKLPRRNLQGYANVVGYWRDGTDGHSKRLRL